MQRESSGNKKCYGEGASPPTPTFYRKGRGALAYRFLFWLRVLRFLDPILRLPLRGRFLCGCGILPPMKYIRTVHGNALTKRRLTSQSQVLTFYNLYACLYPSHNHLARQESNTSHSCCTKYHRSVVFSSWRPR